MYKRPTSPEGGGPFTSPRWHVYPCLVYTSVCVCVLRAIANKLVRKDARCVDGHLSSPEGGPRFAQTVTKALGGPCSRRRKISAGTMEHTGRKQPHNPSPTRSRPHRDGVVQTSSPLNKQAEAGQACKCAHPIAAARASRRDAAHMHIPLHGSVLSQQSRAPSATATFRWAARALTRHSCISRTAQGWRWRYVALLIQRGGIGNLSLTRVAELDPCAPRVTAPAANNERDARAGALTGAGARGWAVCGPCR